MQRNIVDYVSYCFSCQQVKAKHHRLDGRALEITHSQVEVGIDFYRLCDGVASNFYW